MSIVWVVGRGSGGARGSVVSVGVVPWGVGLQEREGGSGGDEIRYQNLSRWQIK
jgi:hypothetical protein